jgi:hypothetical protein
VKFPLTRLELRRASSLEVGQRRQTRDSIKRFPVFLKGPEPNLKDGSCADCTTSPLNICFIVTAFLGNMEVHAGALKSWQFSMRVEKMSG